MNDPLESPVIEIVYGGEVIRRMTTAECIDAVFNYIYELEKTDPLGAEVVYDYINQKLVEGIEDI